MSASGMMLGVFTVVGMSAGQLLFKLAARQVRTEQILLSPYLWIAVCLYGAVTLAWVLLLREIDLASAYPLLAACYR
jgi:hypothetical protein